MKTPTIKYTDEPIGEIKMISDFLPPPDQLVLKEETVKVTLALTKDSVDFFKKIAKEQDEIVEHLSSAAIRYSSEIPKSIMESSNVYSSGKNNNATEDYQDLLQYVFSFDQ